MNSAGNLACIHLHGCDSYKLIVTNVGNQPPGVEVPMVISDTPPKLAHVVSIAGEDETSGQAVGCSVTPVRCSGELAAGETAVITIEVTVAEGVRPTTEPNVASVSGGGAPVVATTEQTVFTSEPSAFGIQSFAFQAFEGDGLPSTQAGGHPYTVATNLYFTSNLIPGLVEEVKARPVEEVKDVIVDLPSGFVGNPQTIPACPLYALLRNDSTTECSNASRVGTVTFEATPRVFRASERPANETTAIYNMKPEPGFPAEFGFTYLGKAIYMYASSVRIGGQLRLRVTVPGIPTVETLGVTLMFFGDSREHFGEAGAGEHLGEADSGAPFFTNPEDCDARELSATIEVDTWLHPGYYHIKEATTYPQVTGCNLLQFQPALNVSPETTQADEPSGYRVTVDNPQNESPLTPATSELKEAVVTLPPGVSLSPAAADGLRACAATGPEGINVGSGETGITGQDIGEPYATEAGEGHVGGGDPSSPYDDGLYHTAPGHCPAASTVGTVEVTTPLLASPLEGHVYVAQPQCGGGGQPPCTEGDAIGGEHPLFGVYLEVAGSGSIVKLAGEASVNPTTGQITTRFRENPQIPFSSIVLHLNGGPRAPLANPQTCGTATASANFTAWSSLETPDHQTLSPLTVPAFSPFGVDWNGAGEACPAALPLTPAMTAETTNPAAGAFSPFVFTLSRGDRQQYLSQLSLTTPPGLLAMISSVPLCEEPQAAAGSCSEASRIGTATVAAGSGSHPYWVTGRVYLTGHYNGAPFGLSIVVPAQAGPFNLGDVVVRSAITVDPNTTAVTVTSTPLPQIIDGIPLRVQTVSVDVERPGFIFNPTNCGAKQISAAVTGAQGAIAHVSSPFAAAGCKSLPFSPSFTASTQSRTSRADGASLDVKVAYKSGQANIRSVAVTLPKQLPARLTTIQQACLAATFEANPATCPAGSLIGVVKASTPVLPGQLTGPAYLVSHGGAAFPDVVIILQGDGVRAELTGNINIAAKTEVTSSTFASIPDAPVTSFEFNLPEGTHSALAINLPSKDKGNLCGIGLAMPTTITGQNGVVVKQSTKIAVSGCPKPKKKAKKKAKTKAGARRGQTAGYRRGGV
jgi:hypothetical protein